MDNRKASVRCCRRYSHLLGPAVCQALNLDFTLLAGAQRKLRHIDIQDPFIEEGLVLHNLVITH